MNIVLDVLRYLEENNIALADAARAAGVAPQNIKKSLSANPKASTILTIAKGLNIDPRNFFYDIDEQMGKETVKEKQTKEELQPVQTVAFCPHCGAKVQVGVVMIPTND